LKVSSQLLSGHSLRAPKAIAAHPNEHVLCVSDASVHRLGLIKLSVRGVQLRGEVTWASAPLGSAAEINSVCWDGDNHVLVIDSSPTGGLLRVNVETSEAIKVLAIAAIRNIHGRMLPVRPFGVAICRASQHFIVISDPGDNTIQRVVLNDDKSAAVSVDILGGRSREAGARDGMFSTARFAQPLGICCDGASILVCDASAGAIRLGSVMTGLSILLGKLRAFYDVFGVHLRGQAPADHTLAEGIDTVRDLIDFLADEVKNIRSERKIARETLNGPDGAFSNDSRHSLQLILDGMLGLQGFCNQVQAVVGGENYLRHVKLKAFTTLALERMFSFFNVAGGTVTWLAYCQRKTPAAKELVKQLTFCGFDYPLPRKPFYPDPATALQYHRICWPAKESLAPAVAPASKLQKRELADYCKAHYKPTQQNRVRVFSKFNAGTMPLSTFEQAVPFSAAPIDLNQRRSALDEKAGMRLPEFERKADAKFAFFAVGGKAPRPAGLLDEPVFIVSVAVEGAENKRRSNLDGFWYVPDAEQPSLWNFMVGGVLRREDILAEIGCEVVDTTEGTSLLVDEKTLNIMLLHAMQVQPEPAAAGGDEDDDAGGVEHDGFEMLGQTQQTSSTTEAENAERKQRRDRRESARDSSSNAASAPRPAKPRTGNAKTKAKPKQGHLCIA
jgi:hypothetical protein